MDSGIATIEPVQEWTPVTPEFTSDPRSRDPDLLLKICKQFNVESNPRYRSPRPGVTWCNIYLWDTTSAMGCEVPHWVDDNGAPVGVGKGRELDANMVCDWLVQHGADYGWTLCSGDDAEAAANLGQAAIITWKNPSGASGHVAICVPTPPEVSEILSAQAGATNFVGQPYTRGFGMRPVLFYKHA